MGKVTLHREEARALLAEARRDLANGAHEFYWSNDEGQRLVIDACVEVIGRLEQHTEDRWPRQTDNYGYTSDVWALDFEFSGTVYEWIERNRSQQIGFIEDLDSGATGSCEDLDYTAKQVYLLHVFNRVLAQREKATV